MHRFCKREEGGTLWKLGSKRRRRKRENLESCKTKENQSEYVYYSLPAKKEKTSTKISALIDKNVLNSIRIMKYIKNLYHSKLLIVKKKKINWVKTKLE